MSAAQNGDRGPWLQMRSGGRFYLLDPRPSEVNAFDVAWALSNTCRFGGHCSPFYSVAQHSVWVSHQVRPDLALNALLHDAGEYVLGDFPRPLKDWIDAQLNGRLRTIERLIHLTVLEALDVPEVSAADWAEIKRADFAALATERRDLLIDTGEEWLTGDEVARGTALIPLGPTLAFEQFVARLRELRPQTPPVPAFMHTVQGVTS